MSVPFDWSLISDEDRAIAAKYLDCASTGPTVMPPAAISFLPGYEPRYQYRWYVTPFDPALAGNVFLHIMTSDDPTDELHDHSWDNTSIVLAGRMRETLQFPSGGPIYDRVLQPGDVKHRHAKIRHRIELPEGVPYCMTLFLIGPAIRKNQNWKIK